MAIKTLSPKTSQDLTLNYSKIREVLRIISEQKNYFQKLKLNSTDISIQNLYLCHRTIFFPMQGTIQALGKPTVIGGFNTELGKKFKEIVGLFTSLSRSTVHFTVNSLVQSHSLYDSSTSGSFVVIDKLQNGLPQIVGGLLEDLFCIGPYELSEDATILAPQALKYDIDFTHKLKTLPKGVEIFYYTGNVENFFNEWLAQNQIPKFIDQNVDPDCVNYFHQIDATHYISVQSILEKIGKVFCSHDITPMRQIETSYYSQQITTRSYQKISKEINEYFSTINTVFHLSLNQKSFIKTREKALSRLLKILYESRSEQSCVNSFEEDKELYISSEYKIDLLRKLDAHAITEKLAHLTGLPFQAYFRESCETIVDAAYQYQIDPIQKDPSILLTQLSNSFYLDFSIEKHKKTGFIFSEGEEEKPTYKIAEKAVNYIVLKGVNFPEISDKIYQTPYNKSLATLISS